MENMELMIFAFFALSIYCFEAKQCGACNKALIFQGNSIREYGISKGLPKTLNAISVCFFMQVDADYLRNKAHCPAYLSYATGSYHNGFALWIDQTLRIYSARRKRVHVDTNLHLADGEKHHVCVTWDLLGGQIVVYVDGKNRYQTTRAGDSIPVDHNGVWVIGQDQDKLGGGFEVWNSVKGLMAEVNVWDRVLCPYEIPAILAGCGQVLKGNVKQHTDFILNGNVQTQLPLCCADYNL